MTFVYDRFDIAPTVGSFFPTGVVNNPIIFYDFQINKGKRCWTLLIFRFVNLKDPLMVNFYCLATSLI